MRLEAKMAIGISLPCHRSAHFHMILKGSVERKREQQERVQGKEPLGKNTF